MSGSALERTATLAGIGLVAGLVGVTAMTLGQKAEMALTRRSPSDVPAQAVEQITGVDVPEGAPEAAFSTAAHFAFGTSLGLGLAVMERVPEPARGVLFFAGTWSIGTALITALGLSDPPTRWKPAKLAIDLGHHAVYAASAAATFVGLRRAARL